MINEKIKLELEKYNIVDNPFDLLMYHSIELTQYLLFACSRMKNLTIPEEIQSSLDEFQSRISVIEDIFTMLMDMDDEATIFCRDTSFYADYQEFNDLNDRLFKSIQKMNTIYTRFTPARKDSYEKIRLGKDSKEYQRIKYLQSLLLNKEGDLFGVDSDYLYKLAEIARNPEYAIKCYDDITDIELQKSKELIKLHQLTEEDIQYLISVYYNYKGDE